MDNSSIPPTESRTRRPLRAPSPRTTAALAAAMLAVGVAVGAAIGPTPTPSLAAGSRLPLLLPSLLAAAGVGDHPSTAPVQPPAIVSQATPRTKRRPAHHAALAAQPSASADTSAPETPSPPTSTTPTRKAKPSTLPPVANVWLIELSGSTLASALETP
ncbi:MAG TPA: hypothetical protein VFY36_00870, partial [Solirubrobacteraceae bacterium]|nr:hypothetical protein [Solirubrobacteraceae bacterium]